MARRFKPSYDWAVKLSEKAAQEKQVASSFVSHWKQVLADLDVEHDSIDDQRKEQLCHVYEAAAILGRFPSTVVKFPDDDRKVGNYLFKRLKLRRWWLHDAIPERFHYLPDIPDSDYQRLYNLRERLRLIQQLNETKARPTNDGFFSGGFCSWDKERIVARLEHDIAVNWTICRLLEHGGVDRLRTDYLDMFRRHQHAQSCLGAAQARARAEKDARRLLAGKGAAK
ncbi:hypothetical protein P3C80_30665 [Pseudomonas aeruginosa]|uniref:hypothetical protein n=1 Tax=Pseudomonas aeruginosa TaxID=287 RepID=UPI0021F1902D|nr:hypothetical protein [Pseudomonas aeruginosa]MCV6101239.1 hypothetical protein [Pseudomonas aeruginosa]MDI2199448.1 hypothetical protein [Pseudomonas aeruginosa]HBO3957640.1 hypothetical protein [Pseudomonas aeruginosa]HCF6076496.1 hypothetical protein [Pseudomonas aeruginosa]HEP8279044.1 hypothetical protein [Pseudomonas aeruginosa]